jgi:hypothetical protein
MSATFSLPQVLTTLNTSRTASVNLYSNSGIFGSASSFVGFSSVMSSKTTYFVLDTEVEVPGVKDQMTAIYVSMINILGKPFYDDVKKQNVWFPIEIEEFLSKNIIRWDRNKKISDIL